MGLSPGHSVFKKQVDTFTTTSTGTVIDVSTITMTRFTLSAKATGAVVSWTVVLEGSIDGVNYTPILTHTNLVGSGVSVYMGVLAAPVLYFRTRCSAIALGLGTDVTATVLGSS